MSIVGMIWIDGRWCATVTVCFTHDRCHSGSFFENISHDSRMRVQPFYNQRVKTLENLKLVWTEFQHSPGVFVRNIGGGGKLVPLIGDTQPLSLISSCKMVRYDVRIQNSSKSIVIVECDAFRLFELVMSRWDFTMSDKFSVCNKFCEQPRKFKAHRHCSNVILSELQLSAWSPNARSNALRIVLE